MKTAIHFVASVLLTALPTGMALASGSTTAATSALAAPQTQAPQRAEGVWIDVRTAQEYQTGHLAGALNIPYEQLPGKIASISPDKDAPIHLYCRSGRRAEAARQELLKMGYTQVINHGGYQDLAAKGIQ